MKRINLLPVLILFSLLTKGVPAYAVLDPGFSYHYEPAETADEYCATADEPFITDDQKCIEAGAGNPPPDRCCTPGVCGPNDAWMYYYGATCLGRKVDRWCEYDYDWYQNDCSASDRCEGGPNRTNACQEVSDAEMFSVSNSSGHILAGQCSSSDCSEEGCKNGGWYKTPGDSHLGGDCHLKLTEIMEVL